MKLNGKVGIETGGASGIGLAIANAFAKEGANVAIGDLDEEGGIKAVDGIQKLGRDAIFVKTNISKREDCKRLIDETVNKFGRIDILVNNAGIQHVSPITDFPEDKWDLLIGVMLTGTFLCTKYALPYMIVQKGGNNVLLLVRRVQLFQVSRYYGNCSSPVAPCEDIAAGPACPSPSKGVTVIKPQAACACAGSANQKTRWSKSARTRVEGVPTSVLTKASAMIASTLSDPIPVAFVVKSPIYSTASKGAVAKASDEVRKTANVVLGGRPCAFKFIVSTP